MRGSGGGRWGGTERMWEVGARGLAEVCLPSEAAHKAQEKSV